MLSLISNYMSGDYDKLLGDLQENSARNVDLRLALKHAHQKIDELEKEVFRYKMLMAGKDEMMNSLGWSVNKPEEKYKGDT